MKWIMIAVGALVGLVVLGFIALVINLRIASARQAKLLRKRLAPVLDPIEAGAPPDAAAIEAMAADAELRNALFDALAASGRAALFPSKYRTVEAYAESLIVVWLAHPNELQKAPDEIELVGRRFVDVGGEVGKACYFLFRFRVRAPHFAAGRGWMAGACGPFSNEPRIPETAPVATFSELTPFDEKSPEEHVQIVHQSAVNHGAIKDLQPPKA